MSTEKRNGWALFGAGILSVILLVAVIWSIMYIISPGIGMAHARAPEVILTLLVIAGVCGLLASLTIVAVVLNALNMGDPSEALSLPKGSVRALIALSLIIIFSITSIYLYGRLAGTPTEEQTRFAQQILTTVSTLAVAVAAFYFGTRSVEAARKAVEKPRLHVSPSSHELKIKERRELHPIKVETTPRDEAIIWEVKGDKPETLVQTKPNEFKYEASKDLPDETVVILTFTLARYRDVSEQLTVKIINK